MQKREKERERERDGGREQRESKRETEARAVMNAFTHSKGRQRPFDTV